MIPEIISFCNIIKLMPYMGIDNDNVKYNSDFIYSNMQFKIDIIHIVSIKNLAILYSLLLVILYENLVDT